MASRCARRAWAAARGSVAKTPVSQEEFEAAVRQAIDELPALPDRLFPHYRYAPAPVRGTTSPRCWPSQHGHFDSPEHAGRP